MIYAGAIFKYCKINDNFAILGETYAIADGESNTKKGFWLWRILIVLLSKNSILCECNIVCVI